MITRLIAAVHHDGDPDGHRGGNADILLDDQDTDITFVSEPDERLLDLRDDHWREPSVGSSMTSRRGLSSSAREIASICCSPPDNSAPR